MRGVTGGVGRSEEAAVFVQQVLGTSGGIRANGLTQHGRFRHAGGVAGAVHSGELEIYPF